MQLVITVWKDRISPLFEATRKLLIAEVRGRRITTRRIEPLVQESALSRADRLNELGIHTLICGGISKNLVKARGIQVVSFASGGVEHVLKPVTSIKKTGLDHRLNNAAAKTASEINDALKKFPAGGRRPTASRQRTNT
jgi:predicted Fe-Mo cluster-binding NifX family protein